MQVPDKPQHPDKKVIEIFWAFLGGLLFSMLPRMFSSEWGQLRMFSIIKWWEHDIARVFNGGSFYYSKIYEFGFGFIVTLLLIWSIKKYKKL